jgi:CspA family cold shock protein
MEDGVRVMGTVQWFSRVKGYGFIRPDDQEEDVFVHYSAIRGEGYRNLNEDQRVEFTMEDTPKGPQAVDVVGIDEEAVEFAAGDTLGDILEESPTVRAIEIDEE